MKNTHIPKALVSCLAIVGVMAYFVVFLLCLSHSKSAELSGAATIYGDWQALLPFLNRPGGLCDVVSNLLLGWSTTKWSLIIMTALMLTVISVLTARLLRVIYGNNLLAPLGLLPATLLAVLHYDPSYMSSGTLAMLLMLMAINGYFRSDGSMVFKTLNHQVLYTLVCTVILYVIAGSIALLYALSMLVIAVFERPRQSAYYLLSPFLVVVLGYISMRTGQVNDQAHALLPFLYYSAFSDVPHAVYYPWVSFGSVLVVCCMFSLYRIRSMWLKRTIQGIAILMVIVTASAVSL